MKKTIMTLLILGLSVSAAYADRALLAWDANDPAPDGYRLFRRVEGQAYDFNSPVCSTGSAEAYCSVDGLVPGVKYLFVVVAHCGDQVSPPSNEAEHITEPVPCLNITDDSGHPVTDIQAGTYLLRGFDYIVEIRPLPEDNDEPPFSINRSKTIFHRHGCRYYSVDRGIQDPAECPTCRPGKLCGD